VNKHIGEKTAIILSLIHKERRIKIRLFIPGNKSTLKIYRYEAKTIFEEMFKGKTCRVLAFAICNHTGFCADNREYPEQTFA
jgi:hypothetical protein